VTAGTLTYARLEESLEAVFSMQSAAMDYDCKGSVAKNIRNSGRDPQKACHQDDLIDGKPPVV
jgi:hypothetical protein